MQKAKRIIIALVLSTVGLSIAWPTITPVVAQDKAGGKTAVAASVTTGSKVNLNTATVAELGSLKGIGPKIAEKIIEFRKTNGAFKEPAELLKVDGVGPKLFESIKDAVVVK